MKLWHDWIGFASYSDKDSYIVRGSYRKSWATIFACKPGTADEGEYGGRWNQLLCYPCVACITWPVSLLTKWLTTICRFTRDLSVLMEVCAWVRAVFEDRWNILKMGTRASKISLGAVALEQPQLNATRRDHSRRQACDCGHNSPNTWIRAQCSTGDGWKFKL